MPKDREGVCPQSREDIGAQACGEPERAPGSKVLLEAVCVCMPVCSPVGAHACAAARL